MREQGPLHGEDPELAEVTDALRVPVTAPAELWPLVAASTIHLKAVRRRTLRSIRGLLVAAALLLVAATAVLTWNVATWWFTSDEPQVRGVRVIGPQRDPGAAGHPGHAGHPTTSGDAPVPSGGRTPPIPPKPPAAP